MVAAVVAALVVADSIKVASDTHLADVEAEAVVDVAAALEATAATVLAAAVAVVAADIAVASSLSLQEFVLGLAEESAVASVHLTKDIQPPSAAVVAADAFVADVALKDASSTKCSLVTQPTLTLDSRRQTFLLLAAT